MLISSVRSNPEITILIVVARLAALALRHVRTAARLNGQNAHTPYTARGRYLVLDVAQTVGRILGAHGACEQSREDNKKTKTRLKKRESAPATSMPCFTLLQAMRERERHGTAKMTTASKQATTSLEAIILLRRLRRSLGRLLLHGTAAALSS